MANLFQPSLSRATDSSGVPINGAKMGFYQTGTLTIATVYSDAVGTNPLSNPVTANSAGIFPAVYLNENSVYRVRLTDSTGGTVIWDIDPVAGVDAGMVATEATNAHNDSVSATASAASALTSSNTAATAASSASTSAMYAAAQQALSNGFFFDTAAEGVSQAVLSLTITAPGTGGANGTFPLAFSGGSGTLAAGTFTVSGGAVTGVNITNYGKNYTGVPTVSLAASTGLTGATVTAAIGNYAVPSGQYYLVKGTGNVWASLYKNVGGVATSQGLDLASYASLAAFSTVLSNTMSTGAFKDLIPGNPTITNITDGGSTSATITHTATGIQISATAFNKILLFSTDLKVGPKHTRFVQTINPSAMTGSVGVGLGFTSGSNYAAFSWSNSGFFSASSNYGGGPSGLITPSAPTYVNGDTLVIQYDITGTGEVYITLQKNSGKRLCFGFTGIPVGGISILQSDDSVTASVIHSISAQSVTTVGNDVIQNTAFGVLNSTSSAAINAAAGFLAAYERHQPSGFSSPNLPSWFKAYRRPDGSGFFTTLSLQPILNELDPTVFTQYVDIVTGSDANAGTSSAPLKTIHAAMTNLGTGCRAMVKIKGGLYDYDNSWQGAQPKASVLQVTSWDGVQVVSSLHDAGLVWSLTAGNTYQATFTKTVVNVFDAHNLTSDGDYSQLTLASSLANCEATAGTYFISGTTIYVHAIDGRGPDANIRVYKSDTFVQSNGIYEIPGGTLYMENIAFEGGYNAFYTQLDDSTKSMNVYGYACTFKYSAQCSPYVNNNGLIIWQKCISAWNAIDGFHYNSSPFGGSNPCAIEQDCIARWNGTGGDPVNNSSSSHGGQSIRIATTVGYGIYDSAQDRGIHDIQAGPTPSLSWHLGITSKNSRNGYANFACGLSGGGTGCKMWLDNCVTIGATYDVDVQPGNTVYTSGTTITTTTGGGTVTSYVP